MFYIGPILSKMKKYIALDVGARWGAEEVFSSFSAKELEMHGFEPDPAECSRLNHEIKNREGAESISHFFHPVALAGSKGLRNFYHTKNPACSSLYAPRMHLNERYPILDVIELERVSCIEVDTLSSWASRTGIDYIDYIKLDTQGSELEILQGAGSLVETFVCAEIEVEFNPIYENQALFSDVDAFMREKGMVLWGFKHIQHYVFGAQHLSMDRKLLLKYDANEEVTNARGGQLFWADALYVRRNLLEERALDLDMLSRAIYLLDRLGFKDIVCHLNALNKQ
ncbi:FkbM family methyltransferase [Synechococcus sp. A10-1-5-9]|uniref:FkbM family methyltransferase n=1 Tax=Synechococcus sp. A10-1-5-9 TaxID=3392295 RepID=UPI0039EB20B7